MTITYDGSFEGFLSLVYEVYYQKLNPTEISKKKNQTLFENEQIEIKTDSTKANKVLKAIKNNFDKKNFNTILNIFMCDNQDFELDLLSFIITGFKNQNELYNINNSFVFNLEKIQKELFYTTHKMKGFVRFIELDDSTLYAKIDTKQNVVYFLGKHFFKRLGSEEFIIHDINRKIAFIKNKNFTGIKDIASYEEPTISENEKHFEKLWCNFFEAVSIKERENRKVQQNFVPLLFRTYMTEFNS